jgi:putative transposase
MMVDKNNKAMTLTKQCELAGINKSSLYTSERKESALNLALMEKIDTIHTLHPYYGARRMKRALQRAGNNYNLKRIRRLMRKMCIIADYPKRNLSKPAPGHKKYPYLLRNLKIERANQVWSMDITYIKMSHGFMYLAAVIDWHSRYVLSWSLSNTMTIDFCKDCLQQAINNYGCPEIFNTDQGCQFTSAQFSQIWEENNLPHVQISMDGKGRATDNAFIERLWRSVKQEKVYRNSYNNGTTLWTDLLEYFTNYNDNRPHQSLNYKTPSEIYQPTLINILTKMNKEKSSKKEILQQQ